MESFSGLGADADAEPPAPRRAPAPEVVAVVRDIFGGNRHTTDIFGLEAFGGDPAAMAEYLMHKCACSTTVKTGADKRTCVFVQGDCTPMLDGALQDLYGVPKKLVRIDDRTKKAKNKKK